MTFSTVAADYMLDQLGSNKALWMSLHSAYSATGANELSGGTYARVAVTWSAAASNSKSLSGTPYNLNAPASSTVAFIGFWDAATSGNFQGMFPNAAGASAYGFAAPSSTGVLLAPGSAYAANATVCVFPSAGSALPGGLTAGTVYYVKSPASDSFSLSATSGGSAITLTSDGSGIVQAVTVETFGSAGTFTLNSGSVSLT
jgi:hypothetical protein